MDVALLTAMASALGCIRESRRSQTTKLNLAVTLLLCGPLKYIRTGALLAFAVFLCAPALCTQADEPGEYQLKAAFLFNFAKFVQWPASAFTSPQSEFEICILGDDPFGKSIDDVLRDKTVGEHRVAILRCKEPSEVLRCQIVFVSSSEKTRLSEVLASLKGANSLVVGDTDGFAESGGAIQFTLENQHVRFVINVDAAERAGLQVSSKLLALARVVRDAPPHRKS